MEEIDRKKYPKMYALNEEVKNLNDKINELEAVIRRKDTEIKSIKQSSLSVETKKYRNELDSAYNYFSAGYINYFSYKIPQDNLYLNISRKNSAYRESSIIQFSLGKEPIDQKKYKSGIFSSSASISDSFFLNHFGLSPENIIKSVYNHNGGGSFCLVQSTANCGANFAYSGNCREEHINYFGLTLLWAALYDGKWMTFFSDYEHGIFGRLNSKRESIQKLFENSELSSIADYGCDEYNGVKFSVTDTILNSNSGNNILSGFIGIDLIRHDDDY